MIHNNKGKLLVRDSVKEDIVPIALNMRDSDVEEVWLSHHYNPQKALQKSFKGSTICMTIELEGKPLAMFGVNPLSIFSKSASVWLLATDGLTKIQKQFIRQSKGFIKYMLEFYPYLHNYCYDKNEITKKWLKWCGASFLGAVPFGVEKKLFNYFVFQRR